MQGILKNIVLIIMLGCMASSLAAQNDTSTWIIGKVDHSAGGAYKDLFKYFTGGDTLIQEKVFQELWKYQYDDTFQSEYYIEPFYIVDTIFVGYLFRDSTKIQAIINEHANDLCPRLRDVCYDSLLTFYDLTLKVGDAVPPPCQSASAPDTIRMDSVKSVSTENDGRRKFYIVQDVAGPGWYDFGYYNYVEDIGSTRGLFNRCVPSTITNDVYYTLLLYCDSSSVSDCNIHGMVTGKSKSRKIDNHNIRFYPNPATHSLHIEREGISEPYDIRIWDVMGTLKRHNANQHEQHVQMDIAGLSDGIYVVEVVQDNKVIAREKIIKQ